MKLLSLIFLTISFSVLATKPDRVNVITPKVAACYGFEITDKDNETLVLTSPKTVNERWTASSVTIVYKTNDEEVFLNRVPYSQLNDEPYIWIGFHNGFKQDHDARIDISYSCTDCESERSEFYSIESIKKFSELSEFSKNEFVCNKSS